MRRLLLTFAFIAACGGSSSSSTAGNRQDLLVQPVGSSSFVLTAPGALLQLAAYESVPSGYGTALQQVAARWSSSSDAVATVDQEGLVTAVANGTARITAIAGFATGEVTVTVGSATSAAPGE